ncbi:hypothetical protein Tco_0182702, partial [Tanacetum coccineum]
VHASWTQVVLAKGMMDETVAMGFRRTKVGVGSEDSRIADVAETWMKPISAG